MPSKAGLLKRLDSAFGPVFCALAARPQKSPETRTLRDFPGGRILVVRPGGIGDAVLLLPALDALRRNAPDSPVDVLCEARNAPLFKLSGLAERVLPYDSHPFRTLRTLRRTQYAAAIDTEQFHASSALFCSLSRAPLRFGFNVAPARNGVYTHFVPYDLQGPESDQFSRLVFAALGRSDDDVLTYRIPITSDFSNLPSGCIALHIGGSAPCKRWSEERFAAVAAGLASRHGLRCVLVGSEADRKAAGRVLDAFQTSGGPSDITPVNLVGNLDLAETATLCAHSILLIGPDSGIAHLAAAVGTPVLVLFGPSDPSKWGPNAGAGRALRHPLPCSPCSMFGYTKPCRSNACMQAITADEVLVAAEEILAEKRNK